MNKRQQPLLVGNWKMNPETRTQAREIVKSLCTAAAKHPEVTIVVAPPAVFLSELTLKLRGPLRLGVQTVHEKPKGAYTGSISLPMCAEFGVTYAILGHSERRRTGETDQIVAGSIVACLQKKVTPIICVGETERDTQANFYPFVEKQLEASLAGVSKTRIKDVVIAYEPVWSIGTGATPTLEEVEEMRLYIYKVIAALYSGKSAARVRIIYGGSVSEKNAGQLYQGTGIAGFLVGGASLNPAEFKSIINAVSTHTK